MHRALLAILSVALLGVGCSPGPIGDADRELVIGTLLPLTGPMGEAGEAARAALDSRLTEIQAAPELSDIRVRLVHTDVRSDSTLIGSAVAELEANNVDVVIGPPTNAQDVAVTELLAGMRETVHLPLSQPARDQAIMMADALVADGHSAVSLLLPTDSQPAIREALTERLEANGAQLLSATEFDPAAERFDPEAAMVASDASSAVLIIGTDSPQPLIDALEDVGAGPSARTTYAVALRSSVTPSAGVRTIEPLAPLDDRVTDRLVLAALAAVSAETDDAATIGSALGKVVAGETSCASFANCLAALREVGTARYAGAAANRYTPEGYPTEVPYVMTSFNPDGSVNEDITRDLTSG